MSPRRTPKIAGWKIALGIFSGIVILPVAGLAVTFFLLSAAPVIPLMAVLIAGFWPHEHRGRPLSRPRPAPPPLLRPVIHAHA